MFTTKTAFFLSTVPSWLSQKFKTESPNSRFHILKTPEMSVQTIRIKTPTSVLQEGFTSPSTVVMLNKIRGLCNVEWNIYVDFHIMRSAKSTFTIRFCWKRPQFGRFFSHFWQLLCWSPTVHHDKFHMHVKKVEAPRLPWTLKYVRVVIQY